MDDHPPAKRLGAQWSLPGQREKHGIAWHGTTACYSAGATGSVWHHMDNGYTNLYSSQESISAVKTLRGWTDLIRNTISSVFLFNYYTNEANRLKSA